MSSSPALRIITIPRRRAQLFPAYTLLPPSYYAHRTTREEILEVTSPETPVPTRPSTPEEPIHLYLPDDFPLIESVLQDRPEILRLGRRLNRLLLLRHTPPFRRKSEILGLIKNLQDLFDAIPREPRIVLQAYTRYPSSFPRTFNPSWHSPLLPLRAPESGAS